MIAKTGGLAAETDADIPNEKLDTLLMQSDGFKDLIRIL